MGSGARSEVTDFTRGGSVRLRMLPARRACLWLIPLRVAKWPSYQPSPKGPQNPNIEHLLSGYHRYYGLGHMLHVWKSETWTLTAQCLELYEAQFNSKCSTRVYTTGRACHKANHARQLQPMQSIKILSLGLVSR